MHKRLAAVGLIFIGAACAWLVLGETLVIRTAASDGEQRAGLDAQWGGPQVQAAPVFTASVSRTAYDLQTLRTRNWIGLVPLALDGSTVNVALNLEQRRKGLLWYNLYTARFNAHYRVRNTTSGRSVTAVFTFPKSGGSFTDVRYAVNGREVENPTVDGENRVTFTLEPGQWGTLDVAYSSRGTGSWAYRLGEGVTSTRNFHFTMTTNFDAIDFPPADVLPTSEERLTPSGWRLRWDDGTIVTAGNIGVAVPYPLQPGPLAARITFWAPLALGFYFFVLIVIVTLGKIDLHPYNYFFLGCAFFAFHLLFAYLVDRIPVEYAFAICSAVSLFLTVSYLRLVAGLRFAALQSGVAQMIYLVLFSYALFNEGWSGLAITIGAIVTLFAVMQLTGRVRWNEAEPAG